MGDRGGLNLNTQFSQSVRSMNTVFSFIGECAHSLDDKGRLTLPGELREELQKSEKPEEVQWTSKTSSAIILIQKEFNFISL